MDAKKQTAVEWLVEQLQEHHINIDIENTVAFHHAKAMEKEQIMDAHLSGQNSAEEIDGETEIQYYNETYMLL